MASSLGNKEVFARNLQSYMDSVGVDRRTLSSNIGVPYTTLTSWLKAETYPRIDKIEILSRYFDINKSDLIEPHEKSQPALQDVYLNFAKEAQANGIDPDDIRDVINILKKNRK